MMKMILKIKLHSNFYPLVPNTLFMATIFKKKAEVKYKNSVHKLIAK